MVKEIMDSNPNAEGEEIENIYQERLAKEGLTANTSDLICQDYTDL